MNITTKFKCTRCGICCLSGCCPVGIEDEKTGFCKFLIIYKNGTTACQHVVDDNNLSKNITIGEGCVLKQIPDIYSYYKNMYNPIKNELLKQNESN